MPRKFPKAGRFWDKYVIYVVISCCRYDLNGVSLNLRMNTIASISERLNRRRLSLGMSCAIVARRSGLSLRTVQRVLSGKEPDVGLATTLAIARVLGVAFEVSDEEEANDFRRRQAEQQAQKVIGLVQGTSALEAQALAAEELNSLRQHTVRDLLAGSNRKLWA